MEEKKKCRCGHEYKMHDRDEGGRTICMLPTCVCNPSPSFPSPKEPEEEWSKEFEEAFYFDETGFTFLDGRKEKWKSEEILYGLKSFIREKISQAKSQGAREALERVMEEWEKLILEDAVFAVVAQPKVGEKFDLEKYNYANQKLNELTSFIYTKGKALLQSNLKEKI